MSEQEPPHVLHTDYLHEVRDELSPILQALTDIMHDTHVVPPGMQWKIPVYISCGFEAEIVLRVRKSGNCEPARDPFGPLARMRRLDQFANALTRQIEGDDDAPGC